MKTECACCFTRKECDFYTYFLHSVGCGVIHKRNSWICKSCANKPIPEMKKHEEVPEGYDSEWEQCDCCGDWSYDGGNFYGCFICRKCLDTPNDVPISWKSRHYKTKVIIEEVRSEL